VLWIAVRREDGDCVASILEANSSINHQAFGTTDAQIGVEEDNVKAHWCCDFASQNSLEVVGCCRRRVLQTVVVLDAFAKLSTNFTRINSKNS